MISFKNLIKGLRLRDNNDTGVGDLSGSLSASDNGSIYNYQNKIKAWLSNSEFEVLTNDQTQTIQNKTIDLDVNTLTNIETDNFKAGVLDTDISTVSGSHDTIPTALATKTYVDNQIATVNDASEINYDNSTSGLTATDVQAAIDEVEGRLDTAESTLSSHTGASSGVHGVTGNVVGTTDTQPLTNKTVDGDLNTITNIANDEIKAGAGIEFSKMQSLTANRAVITDGSGNVTSASSTTSTQIDYLNSVTSDVQAQLNGKFVDPMTTRGDIIVRDATNTSARLGVGTVGQILTSDGTDISWQTPASGGDVVGPASSTDNAIARFDGATGKLLQNTSAVGIDDIGNIVGVRLDADNNTVTNLEVDNLKSGVLDTDLTSVSGSDDTLASAKAIKAYVDSLTIKKNRIINSDLSIWQRGNSFTTTNVFTADRIKARSAGSPLTVSQQTSSDTNKKYKLRIVSNASQTFIQIGSQVEYQDFYDLAGKTVTFKFRGQALNSNTASTNVNVTFYYSTTEDTPIAWGGGAATGIISSGKVLTTSNANYSTSFTMPSNAKSFWWEIGAESSPNSGDGFEIENVMLYEGDIDQDFIRAGKNIQDELAMCQRYYEKSHDLETYTTTGVSWVSTLKHVGNNQYPQLFNTAKRVSPTMTVRNSSTGTSAEVRNDSAGTNLTANFTLSKERGFSLHILGGASAEGQQVSCSWYADAEF